MGNDPNIPVVVVAYNRPLSLKRLLISLQKALYPSNTQLFISVDKSDDNSVEKIARDFKWKHGHKELILHDVHLGLKNHILAVGDLSQQYDGVIVLEDDLYVAPCFYNYTIKAFEFYKYDNKISGISLYTHSYNETARLPFMPIIDGADVFFMQIPSSWGQCWSKEQWKEFRFWLNENQDQALSLESGLPSDVINWPDSSWKKYFFQFLIFKNKYFVYPRYSLTTNFGDPGVHFSFKMLQAQVPLLTGKKEFVFRKISESYATYDSCCEILPACINRFQPHLAEYEYTVDLYGMKTEYQINTEYILTSKPCKGYLYSFARELKPIESNVLNNIEGDVLFLSKYSNCNQAVKPFQITDSRLFYFFQFHEYQVQPIFKMKEEILKNKELINDKDDLINKKVNEQSEYIKQTEILNAQLSSEKLLVRNTRLALQEKESLLTEMYSKVIKLENELELVKHQLLQIKSSRIYKLLKFLSMPFKPTDK